MGSQSVGTSVKPTAQLQCCAFVRHAASQPHSWVHLPISELGSVSVPRPDAFGIHMGCAPSQLERWLRQLKTILSDRSNAPYDGTLRNMWASCLETFARWKRWDSWETATLDNGLWNQSRDEFCQFIIGQRA